MSYRSILFFVLAAAALVLSVVASWSVAGRPDAETWYRNLWRSVTRGPFAGREVYTVRGWRLRNVALILAALAVLVTLLP